MSQSALERDGRQRAAERQKICSPQRKLGVSHHRTNRAPPAAKPVARFPPEPRAMGMISAVADATENRREIGIRGLKATANLMRRDAPQNCFHSSTPSITPGQEAIGLLVPLIHRRDLILLQLPIRHFISPRAQSLLWKPNHEHAQRHASTQTLRRLHERLGRS